MSGESGAESVAGEPREPTRTGFVTPIALGSGGGSKPWWLVLAAVGAVAGLAGAGYVELLRNVTSLLGPEHFARWTHLLVLAAVGITIGALVHFLGSPGDVELLVDNIHVGGRPVDVRALRPGVLRGAAARGHRRAHRLDRVHRGDALGLCPVWVFPPVASIGSIDLAIGLAAGSAAAALAATFGLVVTGLRRCFAHVPVIARPLVGGLALGGLAFASLVSLFLTNKVSIIHTQRPRVHVPAPAT